MKKLLSVLSVLFLILSIAAFSMGVMLFQKREILKGRTLKLESALTAVAATLEPQNSDAIRCPDFPARDIDRIADEPLDTPELSTFWDTYAYELEGQGSGTIDLSRSRYQLAQYYKLDRVTQKPERDPITGQKVVEGPGTMQEILDGVIEAAASQLDRLNDTRRQLADTRAELVTTIEDSNANRLRLRVALSTITEKDASIDRLNRDVQKREALLAEARKESQTLRDDLAEQSNALALRGEHIEDLNDEIAALESRVEELKGVVGTKPAPLEWTALTAGVKGKVAAVNSQWRFVLVDLTDEFVTQYGEALKASRNMPEPDLMVMRETDTGEMLFVTKVRLAQVQPEKRLGVANILNDWEQITVERGDRVVF